MLPSSAEKLCQWFKPNAGIFQPLAFGRFTFNLVGGDQIGLDVVEVDVDAETWIL